MPRSLAAFTGNPRASRTRRKHLSQSPYLAADHTSLIPGRNADAPALQELLAERAVLLRRPSKPLQHRQLGARCPCVALRAHTYASASLYSALGEQSNTSVGLIQQFTGSAFFIAVYSFNWYL